MPPEGCDVAAPGDKLYSSATRKTCRVYTVTGQTVKLLFKSEFCYENKHHLRLFSSSLFSYVVLTFTKQNSSNSDC